LPASSKVLKVLKVLNVLNFSEAGQSTIFNAHRRKGDSERRHLGWTGRGAQSIGGKGQLEVRGSAL
jgi:hypothetical protein